MARWRRIHPHPAGADGGTVGGRRTDVAHRLPPGGARDVRALAFLRAAGGELVSLIVEDWVTFLGGVVALLVMYVLGHDVHSLRAAGGFVAFGLVWVALGISFVRAAK